MCVCAAGRRVGQHVSHATKRLLSKAWARPILAAALTAPVTATFIDSSLTKASMPAVASRSVSLRAIVTHSHKLQATQHTHTHVGPPTLHRPKPRRYVVQRNQILTQENACCTQQAHKSGLRGAASLPRLSSNATGLLPPCRTHKYLERKLFLLNTGGFNATCGDNCAMHSADNTKHTHMQTATITHQ